MSKVVTIRLDDATYAKFRRLAEEDNRPLSNFIETATLRYIDDQHWLDASEQDAIRANSELQGELQQGLEDYRKGRGRFV